MSHQEDVSGTEMETYVIFVGKGQVLRITIINASGTYPQIHFSIVA
jgi:hypothetical protein